MKKQQERKKDKKQKLAKRRKMQIAEAALVLFSKKGYSATTTREIAKKPVFLKEQFLDILRLKKISSYTL